MGFFLCCHRGKFYLELSYATSTKYVGYTTFLFLRDIGSHPCDTFYPNQWPHIRCYLLGTAVFVL